MHALQALVANFEPLDDLHLNLHELNILNLLADISRVVRTSGKKKNLFHLQTFSDGKTYSVSWKKKKIKLHQIFIIFQIKLKLK